MNQRSNASFAVSLAIHGAALLWLMSAPAIRLPRPYPSEYQQKIAGHEEKIVYYKFRRDLPEVTPPKARNERDPLRAEVKARQSIVASPKNAPQAARMVWTPAPEIAAALPDVDLPNVLAVKLPDPPPRPFVTPPDIVKTEIAKVDVPNAPELKPAEAVVTQLTPAELKPVALPPKAFVQPASPPSPVAASPKLAPAAPALETAANLRTTLLPASKLPPKPYVAPALPAARPAIAKAVTVTEAPQLAEATGPSASGVFAYSTKLPARPFTAPHSASPAPSGKGRDVEAPPPLDATSNSRDLNIAIVGLNPNDNAPIPPSASSPGQFSAGPVLRPKGASAEGSGTGLNVPDLFVRGPRDKKVDLIAQAYAAPTSPESLRAVISSRGESMVPAHVAAAPDVVPASNAAPHAAATKVSGAPDPRFNGREVFMMAIQMPNITSYSGSWLMWYSDRTLREAGLAPIAPPVAHRKVDPKYIATAVAERIEGRVTLACVVDKQGHVSGVELVRGIDDRLNRSAEEALSKWEFFPATRKGEPVEVDVLVEIPFHLEPKIERR
jgi:TonB family protein